MYTKKEHIHFVGIGGIGMSGIAIILKQNGYTISGCDNNLEQQSVKQLLDLGCSVHEGNNSAHCHNPSIDILVYIPAYISSIPAINAEICAAQARGIPTIARAQMLQELMRSRYGIAITGSHGKTTTTALIAHILITAHFDPTVVIGGHITALASNARYGNGDFLVAEADESDRSFLYLHPTLAVITNIDLEHLETYTDLDDIKNSFRAFINNIPFYGKAIVCNDDANIRSLMPFHTARTITYGCTSDADIFATEIDLQPTHSTFTVLAHAQQTQHHASQLQQTRQTVGTFTLPIAGKHNLLNSLAAIAVTSDIGISSDIIACALATFGGVERRFEYHGTYNGAEIFDDYGHHPTEIESTLLVARKRTKNKLTVVFQPHRYTRTEKLWHDFITILSSSIIDTLIITDIHAASEKPIDTITSKRLVSELNTLHPALSITYAPLSPDFSAIKNQLDTSIAPDDLVLFLGAGSIYQLAHKLTQ